MEETPRAGSVGDQPSTESPTGTPPEAATSTESGRYTTASGDAPDAGAGWTSSGESAQGPAREWLVQLQSMIEGLASQAAPVVREIGAKAAELAAVAGEKAGPIAHKAAEATEQAGAKIAERGREVAAELRRDAGSSNGPGTTAGSAESADRTEETPVL